ncbi:hypothetical protein GJW-30_1_01937 [Variibacter gotjawalensis]|uniref:DUF3489 domain-containing protein n=1 Tax=Variibacter gotjawalensis TaxID=1333996 RepID=A0A0S3PU37_9BRAD|nr:DUF3489 domain-containing protein [Variibacter gotjawalensis]NIK49721.1 hypothetical protein [Variibacter gotjawalensis]RZS45731.1 uncharacterized protein DUF3489 [Variibacter gotjawalensis]BAT59404.1 hypothetical protein GJW-30_1_01937 [Variibacter gotjawalensis]
MNKLANTAKAPSASEQRRKGKVVAKKPATNPIALTIKKQTALLIALRLLRGSTIARLVEVSGWQAHSARGFLTGKVKQKLALILLSEKVRGVRRYRILP